MELVSFFESIPNNDNISAGQLIPYFMYYLHNSNKEFVAANDIRKCFSMLKIKPYSNITSWLTNNSKKKDSLVISEKAGFTLSRLAMKDIQYKLLNPAMKEGKETKQENQDDKKVNKKKVFIVHGHDELAREQAARFVEREDYEAIILHEKASGGKTIIEKIEKYSDVSFAIILYTPCDIGCDRNQTKTNNRARQNVVFEHGFLIGKLGREKVCALVKDGVETPGDISGVVYIKMDKNGAWKMKLAKEMELAGLEIDYGKIVQ